MLLNVCSSEASLPGILGFSLTRKSEVGNGQFALQARVPWAGQLSRIYFYNHLSLATPWGLPKALGKARTTSLCVPGASGNPGGRSSVASV